MSGEEFWIGLDNLFELTNRKNYSLKITAVDVDGVEDSAIWTLFGLRNKVKDTFWPVNLVFRGNSAIWTLFGLRNKVKDRFWPVALVFRRFGHLDTIRAEK